MWPHSHCKSSGSLTCVSVTAPLVSIGIAPSFCTASIGKGTVQTLTGWFHWSRGNWAIYSTRFVTQLVLTGSSRPARVLSSLIGSVLIQPTCDWIDSLFNWWLFAIEAIKSRGASQWSWFSHLVCLFVCLLCLRSIYCWFNRLVVVPATNIVVNNRNKSLQRTLFRYFRLEPM